MNTCGVLLGAMPKELDEIAKFSTFEDFNSFERKAKSKSKRIENNKIRGMVEVDKVCEAV